ncbi:MAG TPA: NAD(P)H-dependent oxidoreductase [Patescibacteria group bacterium]|jgi:NAD(P)H-dependent FMN reductase|nr:NAD(P)H-dependent oxidoreductase [Patescibacteria group bacterium]
MVKIGVVIGSSRQGRVTDKLAKWVAKVVSQKATVELLDLREYPMPFMDEPISPRYNPKRQPEPAVKKWLDKIVTFDGYVFVTPEYNRSTSAVLKNSIDMLAHEIDDKPVALVGHGTSGGAQAIANLRMALPGVGAITIPQALFFSDHIADSINDKDDLKQELREKPYGPQTQLDTQIDSLIRYAEALKAMR